MYTQVAWHLHLGGGASAKGSADMSLPSPHVLLLAITLEVLGNYWDEKQIRVVQVYEMHTISRTSSGLILRLA